jgi:ankyrin repeat protein
MATSSHKRTWLLAGIAAIGILSVTAWWLNGLPDRRLRTAIWDRDLEAAIRSLDSGADPNRSFTVFGDPGHEGFTPLLLAIESRNVRLVALLIDRGADVNQADRLNRTPLVIASNLARTEAVQMLIAHGADVNAKQPAGPSPLMLAAENDDVTLVDVLLAAGADMGATDMSDWDALCCAAYRSKNSAVIERLRAAGADPHRRTRNGITPIELAQKRTDDAKAEILAALLSE